MKVGMMWYFDGAKTTQDAIKAAMEYYIDKYGLRPTICVLNDYENDPEDTYYLKIERQHWVLPKNLWIGVSNEPVELSIL